jgi:hypothetical protein
VGDRLQRLVVLAFELDLNPEHDAGMMVFTG